MLRTLPFALLLGLLPAGTEVAGSQPSPFDTTLVGAAPYSEMSMLFEKTIFKVDVLTLDVRVGEETAARLGGIVRELGRTPEARDSIANVAIHSADAWARITFQRDVSLHQFLDGVDENMRKALRAGIISEEQYRVVADGLPRWFSFLKVEGIHDGDRILYRIAGDSLRTVFQTAAGEVRLDQTDVGPGPRLTLLGSYFAPRSDFRDKLIRSLYDGRVPAGGPPGGGASGADSAQRAGG